MKRLLLITFLLLSSGPAYAEWVSVAEADDGMTVYVDRDTIRRKGNLVEMWLLYDYKTVRAGEQHHIVSVKMQSEYDCPEERFRTRAILEYSGNMGRGKVVFTDSNKGTWKPVAPGSPAQALLKVACDKK